MGISLSEIFDSRSIRLNLESKTKEAVFDELTEAITAVHPECDRSSMIASLWERENKLSTGIASGVAIPHSFCNGMTDIVGAIGVSQSGIDYNALDNKPVYVVFMLIIGGQAHESHLHILNQLFALAQSEGLASIKKAKNAQTVTDILSGLR
ncbi:MAG: PTS sugar transporter subunit IIA [Treponema sp.]|jgi:mannitol/fructose-specific phosphotransferase system IIA component (Ntr-type)|nr:PTS sugar transporter subunit IIA [Treponema sp.]